MVYTLADAAKATGKSRATISSAVKSGRIPAMKDDSGTFRIDPAELYRIYPRTVFSNPMEAVPTPPATAEKTGSASSIKDGAAEGTVSALQARLEAALDRLSDTEARLSDKNTIIAELREDRDRWRQQATTLLAGHRPPKGVLARLFGR